MNVEQDPQKNIPNHPQEQNSGEQKPLGQAPLTSLAPPASGGKKPLIIIAILVAVIGLGLWALSGLKKDKTVDQKGAGEKEEKVVKKKPKLRKAEKTDERPMKKEMAELSKKNRDDFEENIGKWVRLEGLVETGDEEGVIIFKEPAKMRGQLVRGSAENLTGQIVRVIGWMLSDELIQVDGVFDIETVDPIDLLPKKKFYTVADEEQSSHF